MIAMDVGIWGRITDDGVFWGIFDDPGIWGPIIYGGVFIGLFLIILIFIIYFVVSRRRWANKQARLMIDSGQINPKTIDKTLKILASRTKNLEAQNLFRKLYNIIQEE